MPSDTRLEVFAPARGRVRAWQAAAGALGGQTDNPGAVFQPNYRRTMLRSAERDAAAVEAVDVLVVRLMVLDLVSSVVLQRIYYGGVVSITLVTHLAVVALLLVKGRLSVAPLRILMFWMLWGGAFLSQRLSTNLYSFPSILLGAVCYIGFLGVVPASRATYIAVIKTFQKVAMAVAVLVFLDIGLQLIGLGQPDMNAVVPASLLPPSMNYIQPAMWGSSLTKPNAFFMMEASYTSQFIAIGLVIELVFFRRWRWILAFSMALLGTISGTGLMLLILTLPIMARRILRPLLMYGIILLPLLGVVAVETGWYDIAKDRTATFDNSSGSANGRFVEPFLAMYDTLTSGSEHTILYGYGAGSTAIAQLTPGLKIAAYNAVSKVLLEYGIVICLLFLIFISYCLFFTGVPFVIAWAAAIEYHFMGGHLQIPTILNYCYVLTAGWAIYRHNGKGIGPSWHQSFNERSAG